MLSFYPLNTPGGSVIPNPHESGARNTDKGPRVNEQITAPEVRLIGADGSQIGIVKSSRAREAAEEAGLDLVEIAPMAKPPVCKIIDFGKYRYELSKKAKDARKKQHVVHLKRIQLSPNIDDHDFQVKANAARRFIEAGHRVKAIVFIRGRLITRKEMAEAVLTKLATDLADVAKTDGGPKMEAANSLSLLLLKKK